MLRVATTPAVKGRTRIINPIRYDIRFPVSGLPVFPTAPPLFPSPVLLSPSRLREAQAAPMSTENVAAIAPHDLKIVAEEDPLKSHAKEDPVKSHAEEDPVKSHAAGPRERRRRLLRRGAYGLVAVLVVAAVVLVTVGLTVYKVREPRMTMNSVDLQWDNLPENIILRVAAVALVKNRNDVTYHFQRSFTSVYWNGEELANATGPSGKTGGGRTYRMELTLDVSMDKLAALPTLMDRLKEGVLQLNSSTTVNGHVKVFGMFRHHVDVFINCTVSLDLWKEVIIDQLCNESVSV